MTLELSSVKKISKLIECIPDLTERKHMISKITPNYSEFVGEFIYFFIEKFLKKRNWIIIKLKKST